LVVQIEVVVGIRFEAMEMQVVAEVLRIELQVEATEVEDLI
jgi:hypothetical protein